jgi:predicted TIM-barrel fold metal-dependent hydrolase
VATVAALCAGAVALAVAASGVTERAFPGFSRPRGDLFAPLAIPKIDVHQHVAPGAVDAAIEVARRHGIAALVNLSGGAEGAGLEPQLAAARKHGGRVIVFMNLDFEGCCGAAWAEREAARLARGQAIGARGLKVPKALGLGLVDEDALRRGASRREARLPVDSPLLDPIWRACAALRLPVVLHAGDPKAFFDPPGLGNERAAELELFPAWSFADRERYPTWQEVFDESVRLVERHPQVTFVGAHFGNDAEDPATVARLLDRLPNLWIDTAARVPELGRRPEAVRQAVLAHPGRVLFGTDLQYVERGGQQGIVLGSGLPILLDAELLGGRERRTFLDSTFRFFETRDAEIPSPTPIQGAWDVTGLGLPRAALQRLYHENAERLLHVSLEELDR